MYILCLKLFEIHERNLKDKKGVYTKATRILSLVGTENLFGEYMFNGVCVWVDTKV